MGYYTHFSLSNLNTQDRQVIEDALEDISGYPCLWLDSVKWYDWEKDLANVSTQFNDPIYLCGIGEESEDIWVAKAHKGIVEVKHFDLSSWDPWSKEIIEDE